MTVKVLSRDEVEIDGLHYVRSTIANCQPNCGTGHQLCEIGRSEVLRLMDAYEEPAPEWEPGMYFEWLNCVDQWKGPAKVITFKNGVINGVFMAGFCRHVPPPKEEKPSQESPSPLQSVIDECVGKREFRGDCIFECTGTIKDGLRWKRVLSKDQLDDAISRAVETSEQPKPNCWRDPILSDVSGTLELLNQRTNDLKKRLTERDLARKRVEQLELELGTLVPELQDANKAYGAKLQSARELAEQCENVFASHHTPEMDVHLANHLERIQDHARKFLEETDAS